MNTDIRIDWQSGMEITPQTFIDMENNIYENRLMIRKMIAAKNYGIIPRTKFAVVHEVFNDTLLIKQIDCDLLLPSGQVVVIELNVNRNLQIPDKDAKELFLTVEAGENTTNFVKDGIPHVANEYKLSLKTLDEIRNAVPLLKLQLDNENWTTYPSYIMPVMTVRSSLILMEKLDLLKQSLQKIVDHENVEIMEGRVMVMVLLDQLANFSVDDSSRELVLLCKRIATALSYSILNHKSELPAPNINDIEPYLNAFMKFVEDIAAAMNDLQPKVVEVKEKEKEPGPPVVDEWMPMI